MAVVPLVGTSTDDEGALVARAQRDRQEFAHLYRQYLTPVYRYCYRRLGSQEAAEDATGQIFAQALAALRRNRSCPFLPRRPRRVMPTKEESLRATPTRCHLRA